MTLRQVRNYIIAVGFITLLMIGTIFFTNRTLRNAVGVVRDLTTLQEVVLSIDQIDLAMEEERISIGQYQLTGDEELLARIDQAQANYDRNWAVILDKRGAEQAEVLADIEESRNVYVGLLNQVIDSSFGVVAGFVSVAGWHPRKQFNALVDGLSGIDMESTAPHCLDDVRPQDQMPHVIGGYENSLSASQPARLADVEETLDLSGSASDCLDPTLLVHRSGHGQILADGKPT